MKAVVLLSGGIDSTTTLYWAINNGFNCECLIFNYGQRHKKEIKCATKIAHLAKVAYKIINLDFNFAKSAITDRKIPLPQHRRNIGEDIPITYVPARNTIFLAYALGYAEATSAKYVFIGAHAQDYSGYPDCRPQYFKVFNELSKIALKVSVEGNPIEILTPLIDKKKSQILRLSLELGVPLHLTWSCYSGKKRPCGYCDSCIIRERAFKELNLTDPLWQT